MTKDKDFKNVVRARAAKTGQSYSSARRNLVPEESSHSEDSSLTVIRDRLAGSLFGFWDEFRPQLKGLTDEEYLWEPVPGCPTIRRNEAGEFRVDGQFPVKGAASIAQRLCWVANLMLVRTNQHFGDQSILNMLDIAVPGKATGGVDHFEEAFADWRNEVGGCDPARLVVRSENRAPGSIDGTFLFVQVIEHQFQLLVQCCSQVSMTRDLYAAHNRAVVS